MRSFAARYLCSDNQIRSTLGSGSGMRSQIKFRLKLDYGLGMANTFFGLDISNLRYRHVRGTTISLVFILACCR